MTLSVVEDYSLIASFSNELFYNWLPRIRLTTASRSPSAIAELLVARTTLCSLEILFPNSALRKFDHGTPTISDVNSDSGRSVIYGATWRQRPKWQVRSTVNGDRRLLIALDVQLCVLRDGLLGVRYGRAVLVGAG